MSNAKVMGRRIHAAMIVVAVLLLVGVFSVSPWALQSGQGPHTCAQRQAIAKGQSPGGIPWTLTGSIGRDGRTCKAWLLRIEFRPDRKPYSVPWEGELSPSPMPGSFSWGWGIPAGGHLANSFTINGRDEYEGSERVFAGVAGARVKSIVLTMNNGQHMTIRPLLPAPELRRRFVWLRNLRYFVRYYPLESHVRLVTVRKDKGIVVSVRGEEGAFATHSLP
jgi:hypothetical protein